MRDRRQHDLRGERQRRDHRPGSDRAVVGAVGDPPGAVVEEPPFDAIELADDLARSVTRGDPPAELPILRVAAGVADPVLLLHEGGAPAVLEIIDPLLAHERVLDAAKIDPHVGELMREQRSRVQELGIVDGPPSIGRCPRPIALRGERVRRRSEPEHVQQQRLVIPFPPVRQESTLGSPPVGHGGAAVLGPLPIDARVQPDGEVADLALGRRVPVEVRGGGQHAAQQEGGVDRRQLALPRARSGLRVEKVIVEPLVARRVGLGSLLAPPEEPQGGERARPGLGARDESALDADRIRGEPQPHRRDARRPAGACLVEHQSIRALGLVQKVAERPALDRVEHARLRVVGAARPAHTHLARRPERGRACRAAAHRLGALHSGAPIPLGPT